MFVVVVVVVLSFYVLSIQVPSRFRGWVSWRATSFDLGPLCAGVDW